MYLMFIVGGYARRAAKRVAARIRSPCVDQEVYAWWRSAQGPSPRKDKEVCATLAPRAQKRRVGQRVRRMRRWRAAAEVSGALVTRVMSQVMSQQLEVKPEVISQITPFLAEAQVSSASAGFEDERASAEDSDAAAAARGTANAERLSEDGPGAAAAARSAAETARRYKDGPDGSPAAAGGSSLSSTWRSTSWAELSEHWEDDEDDIPDDYFEQHLLRATAEQKLRETPANATFTSASEDSESGWATVDVALHGLRGKIAGAITSALDDVADVDVKLPGRQVDVEPSNRGYTDHSAIPEGELARFGAAADTV